MIPIDDLPTPTLWPTPIRVTNRTTVEAVCCPACQSIDVRKYKHYKDSVLTTWLCSDCNWTWREPAHIGRVRAAVP